MLNEQSNTFPDFSSYGYQIVNELGRNKQGGRITYKARYLKTNHFVAIKRFSFHTTDWEGLKEIEREIKVLKGLVHPGIPKYLDTFHHEGLVCLVQEYINAASLKTDRSYQLEEIELIALQGLEILAYIQQQKPPVIHRDLKPENLLWDGKTLFLIDFGFARVHNEQSISVSSMALGTYGFMPPEALSNRLNLSSDLYSLGVTLICLLCGISSNRISSYIDDDCQIDAKRLLNNVLISSLFKDWLQKLVSRKLSVRYANAALALEAFKFITNKNVNVIEDISHPASAIVLNIEKTQISKSLSFSSLNRSLKSALRLAIPTIGIGIISFPWIAVQSDAFFSLQKQIQKNSVSWVGKVDPKYCSSYVMEAANAPTARLVIEPLNRSIHCLEKLGYPKIEPNFKELLKYQQLIELYYGRADSKIGTILNNQRPSLNVAAMNIESALSIVSSSKKEMDDKIFNYILSWYAAILIGFGTPIWFWIAERNK